MATISKWKPKKAIFTESARWMPQGYWQVGLPVFDSATSKWWQLFQDSTTIRIVDWTTQEILVTVTGSIPKPFVMKGSAVVSAGILYVVIARGIGTALGVSLIGINMTTGAATVLATAQHDPVATLQVSYGSVVTDGTYVYFIASVAQAVTGWYIHSIRRHKISDGTALSVATLNKGTVAGLAEYGFGPISLVGANLFYLDPYTSRFMSVAAAGGTPAAVSAKTCVASGFKGWHVTKTAGAYALENSGETVSVALDTFDTILDLTLCTDETTPSIHYELGVHSGFYKWSNAGVISGNPYIATTHNVLEIPNNGLVPLRGGGIGVGSFQAWTELGSLSKEAV